MTTSTRRKATLFRHFMLTEGYFFICKYKVSKGAERLSVSTLLAFHFLQLLRLRTDRQTQPHDERGFWASWASWLLLLSVEETESCSFPVLCTNGPKGQLPAFSAFFVFIVFSIHWNIFNKFFKAHGSSACLLFSSYPVPGRAFRCTASQSCRGHVEHPIFARQSLI